MTRVIVATANSEGGLYSPDTNSSAPIRIYSNGDVEDEFCRVSRVVREIFSKTELRHVVEAAQENRERGLI
jgi:hypothetical protein